MTHLVSATQPLPGSHAVRSYPGHGILGSDLPTDGDNGGSPALNDGIDLAKRYAWRVVTPPSVTLLTIYPDLSFEQLRDGAPDGSYPWSYQLLEDGQALPAVVVTTTFGVANLSVGASPSAQATLGTQVSVTQEHKVSVSSATSVVRSPGLAIRTVTAGAMEASPSVSGSASPGVSIGQTYALAPAPSHTGLSSPSAKIEGRAYKGVWVVNGELANGVWTLQLKLPTAD